jgi:hypothetical protein
MTTPDVDPMADDRLDAGLRRLLDLDVRSIPGAPSRDDAIERVVVAVGLAQQPGGGGTVTRRPAAFRMVVVLGLLAALVAGAIVVGATLLDRNLLAVLPTPSKTATPSSTPAPVVTPAPTPPTGPALLEEQWVQAALTTVASVAVRTDSGWVALGNGCGGGCDSFSATALTSTDGLAWSVKQFEDVDGPYPVAIGWAGDRFFGLGDLFTPTGNPQAIIWESGDGTSWERSSAIDLGDCDVGCLDPQALALTPNGVLVLGTGRYKDAPASGIYRSENGRSWTKVALSAFGIDGPLFEIVETIVIGDTIVLAGGCEGCPLRLWSSTDGKAWTSLGSIDGPMPSLIEMASDGERLVLAQERCADDVCAMSLWSGPIGGPLSQIRINPRLTRPRLAYSSGVFALAGMSPEGPRVFASLDGLTWSEQAASLDFELCTVADLVGGPDSLLLLTDPDCTQVWLGRTKR